MTVKLSARLHAVARRVPTGAVVADIGTDHAYLPVFLVRTGLATRVIAGEAGRGPFKSARETVRSYGLDGQIEVRLGDGLQVLRPGEADTVVLAGMGGRTICAILSAGHAVLAGVERLLLQPMRDVPLVRRWLLENGWRLFDEEMVYEGGHYYVVIESRPGRERIGDPILLELGPRLLEKRDAVYHSYLQKKRNELKAVLAELQGAKGKRAAERYARLHREAVMLEEVLENWQSRDMT